jgi:hypothetical protein
VILGKNIATSSRHGVEKEVSQEQVLFLINLVEGANFVFREGKASYIRQL